MRRAAAEGLLRGDRTSPRKFSLSRREEEYLRRHWGLLAALRAALRTEPAVRLAVLFGSVARGTDHERSDVDVLVDVRGSTPAYVADIAQRLSERLDREVQLVTLDAAQRAGSLMAGVLEDGRVLVDREGRWPALVEQAGRWRRVARRERAAALEELPDWLDL
jgi:predicted nucleotidyltransferase